MHIQWPHRDTALRTTPFHLGFYSQQLHPRKNHQVNNDQRVVISFQRMDWVLAYDLHIIYNLTWLEVRDDPDECYKDFGPTKISANRKRGDPPLFSKTQRTNVLYFCHKMHTNRKTWAWCWLAQEKHKWQGDQEIEKKRERQKEEPEKKEEDKTETAQKSSLRAWCFDKKVGFEKLPS